MKFINLLCYLTFILSLLGSYSNSTAQSNFQDNSKSILIFTKTVRYRHQSIEAGVKAVKKLASKNGINTLHTENASYIQQDSLADFDAVLFLSTSGNVLNSTQEKALRQHIKNSGAFMGIHGAAATEGKWPWYGKMIGAQFEGHPDIQEATINIVNKKHPSTSFMDDEWERTDEWYNFSNINSDITVLMKLDESSYKGGKNGPNHPIAWYHEFKGSRIFYTAGGHTKESYRNERFLRHLWGGIQYVLEIE